MVSFNRSIYVLTVLIRSLLDSLPELWDEEQYTEEYDMDNYIKNLAA